MCVAKGCASAVSKLSVRSAAWQATALEQERTGLAAYLERVTVTAELQEIARRSMDALALARGQRVLEEGCGTGVFLPLQTQPVGSPRNVVGIDHAPDFVEQARHWVVNFGLDETVTVEQGDVYRLPFAVPRLMLPTASGC